MQPSESVESPDKEFPATYKSAGPAAAAGTSPATNAGTPSPLSPARSCPTCSGGSNGTVPVPYVYAIGRVDPRVATKLPGLPTGRPCTRSCQNPRTGTSFASSAGS